jgi:hypothetical protein
MAFVHHISLPHLQSGAVNPGQRSAACGMVQKEGESFVHEDLAGRCLESHCRPLAAQTAGLNFANFVGHDRQSVQPDWLERERQAKLSEEVKDATIMPKNENRPEVRQKVKEGHNCLRMSRMKRNISDFCHFIKGHEHRW